MLQSSKEVARVRLGAAAKSGLLLPQGLFASPEREVIQAKAGPSGFGRKAHLLCPFFDNAKNGCSVWEHRPGVCSSYFCKSEKNEEGLELWADIEAYLNQFEWTLANAVLWRLGFTQDDLGLSEAVMLSESSGPERAWLQKRAWVEWSGRELELYDRCASESYEIKTEELDELLGEDCLSLENSIRERSA
jgi:Fe-S-cluster containining protein